MSNKQIGSFLAACAVLILVFCVEWSIYKKTKRQEDLAAITNCVASLANIPSRKIKEVQFADQNTAYVSTKTVSGDGGDLLTIQKIHQWMETHR